MDIKVVKRNGKLEAYNPEKIIRVLKAAGLDQVASLKLTERISTWLLEREKPQVTSLQIRDRVIVEIQKVDKEVAKKFISYEKYKDKHFSVNY
ncbi:hypothetical protein A2865_01760 [Candidatus Woesebacteria bacterium RIFCSPHIGHO2_01_FULL_39_17]|uniref:ATP-cone domain protein n=3 Tax=Candidatus Woeseibacteriota TaxID=1752722 RepID=A0A0G0NDH9_9BACT|nr:MAG: ATP-cone domain protein [Microgenomates group bacterium GW2011_GWC1_38_12]KKQ94244.1 MAG: ATP-cone domain protein [Candidatus Woesebacteria bacterium GW2011_GWB1_39_10b]KKR14184.1 MAG: ATP-cone domain protein [Candidatus Woesebacteria bacterium GW2011_GWA1_39_21b]OGM23523.1 MAG: hypothetical protein A2865_01760 [Candidatus Woesebacteria bacterium RIFCSPHIGHO2_01_FULL_39_17]OGM63036.1 MAG: hypothetical protein A3A52_00665 [Candidatus Woesebacteria bacterium RIFCSPLOWO2_01_FULL_39_14]